MTKEKKGKYNIFTDVRRNKVSYLMLIPAAMYTFIFGYCTIPYMIIAFEKFSFKKGIFGSKWVGMKNFEFFFKSQDAGLIIGNTVKLNLLFLLVYHNGGVTLAIMINEIRNNISKNSSVHIPASLFSFLDYCKLYPLWNYWQQIRAAESHRYFLRRKINQFLQRTQILDNHSCHPKVWKDLGMNMVIYLATITGFDEELYDAAAVDGAEPVADVQANHDSHADANRDHAGNHVYRKDFLRRFRNDLCAGG